MARRTRRGATELLTLSKRLNAVNPDSNISHFIIMRAFRSDGWELRKRTVFFKQRDPIDGTSRSDGWKQKGKWNPNDNNPLAILPAIIDEAQAAGWTWEKPGANRSK
jgi:hypothetical protein